MYTLLAPRRRSSQTRMAGLGFDPMDWFNAHWKAGTDSPDPTWADPDYGKVTCPTQSRWDIYQKVCVSEAPGTQVVTCPEGMVRNLDASVGPIGCVPEKGGPSEQTDNGISTTTLLLGGVILAVAAYIISQQTDEAPTGMRLYGR